MLQILFSLLCLKYIFFWFYRSVRFKAKERVRTCKDYGIGREITTILKIAVDSVTLQLCDSRDYFANSLLVKKTYRDFEERKLLFITLVSNYSSRSCRHILETSSRLRPLRHRRFCNINGLWCNRRQGVNSSCVVVVSCAAD